MACPITQRSHKDMQIIKCPILIYRLQKMKLNYPDIIYGKPQFYVITSMNQIIRPIVPISTENNSSERATHDDGLQHMM